MVLAAAAPTAPARPRASAAPRGPARETRPPPGPAARLAEAAYGYQRALAANPHDAQALMGMSLVALASGQRDAAVKMAAAALAEAPKSSTAWVTLGQALKSSGQWDEAELAYANAIRLDGANPLVRMSLGELKLATGRPAEALRDYELAIQRRPALVAAQMGLGHALACLGRNDRALERYEHVLILKPRLAEAEFAAGYVLARLGKPQEAEIRYRRVLAARPDFAAAWLNLGGLLREQGRELQAEAALGRAIELRPDLIPAWLNLALLERQRCRPSKAEAHLLRALELDSGHAETLVAWCQFRNAEADPAGARDWLARALAANPRHAEAVNMRGILAHNEGRFEEAVAAFADAEALGSLAAKSNRGNSLLELGRDAEALNAHEAAVDHDPQAAGALYNLALTRLRLGDWKRGWRDYEARWRFREVHRNPRLFRQPRWHGEPLHGRRILLHAEQGLGDTIQFCRYASMVAERGGKVILQVQAPLERLMHSLRAVESGLAQVSVLGGTVPEFDVECPLMSLPAIFDTAVETVPWTGAYLGADPAIERQRRAQHPPTGHTLRVGIAWAGNPRYKSDRQRSTKLQTLLPLLGNGGIDWISLQKGDAAEQLAHLPGGIVVHDGASRDAGLADTAALIATLDLVITTDTSIAHLAGAMAKPVWILLPYLADWRWMQRTGTTPWYPSARLLRQSEPGDWAELIHKVRAELNEFQSERGR